jgi:hypothetical protein
VVATAALLAAPDDELLAGLAAGRLTAALAVPFASQPFASQPFASQPFASGPAGELAGGVRVTPPQPGDPDGQARLTGTITGVADALPADVLLVPADGVPAGLYAVQAGAPGLTTTPVVSLDQTRQLADLALDSVPARPVAAGQDAAAAVRAALTAGAAMLASEQLGLAEKCLEITVSYLKERYQFARPVGSFQALKHRPGTPPPAWPRVTRTRRWRWRWPRRPAATRPRWPPRSACSCTAASGSPGSTRRTCT